MADIRKFSDQVIDLAERLANVADAAKGKDTKTTGLRARWLLLPAAGAGIYAVATSGAFTRQAKTVVNEAKTRASDLPDELVSQCMRQRAQRTGQASVRTQDAPPSEVRVSVAARRVLVAKRRIRGAPSVGRVACSC